MQIIFKQTFWTGQPTGWWLVSPFVSGAGSPRFKYRAGQIGRSVANGSLPQQHFFERCYVVRRQWREDELHKLITRVGVLQRVH